MATSTSRDQQKKLEFKPVGDFDVSEIVPDAPEGEWKVSIPRGRCKVQPTKDDKFPMIVVPVRLDGTTEDDEAHEKAIGTELTAFLVFGGKTPRGSNLAKLRIRQICEAADVDLDLIPKKLTENAAKELDPLVKALEGKKFTAWTVIRTRTDTGEEVTELRFQNPNRTIGGADDDDDDDDDDNEPESGAAPKGKKKNKSNGRRRS